MSQGMCSLSPILATTYILMMSCLSYSKVPTMPWVRSSLGWRTKTWGLGHHYGTVQASLRNLVFILFWDPLSHTLFPLSFSHHHGVRLWPHSQRQLQRWYRPCLGKFRSFVAVFSIIIINYCYCCCCCLLYLSLFECWFSLTFSAPFSGRKLLYDG